MIMTIFGTCQIPICQFVSLRGNIVWNSLNKTIPIRYQFTALEHIYIVMIHNAAYQIMAFHKVEPITTANKDEFPYAITPE